MYSHLVSTRGEMGCRYDLFERYCLFSIYRALELGSLPWPNEYIDSSDVSLPVDDVVFIADVLVGGKHVVSAVLEAGEGRAGVRYRGSNVMQDTILPIDGERSTSDSGSDDEGAMPMSVFGRATMVSGGGLLTPEAGGGTLSLSDVSYTLYAARREEGGAGGERRGMLALVDRLVGQSLVVIRNTAQR